MTDRSWFDSHQKRVSFLQHVLNGTATCVMDTGCFFSGTKRHTTHASIMPQLRMTGASPLLPMSAILRSHMPTDSPPLLDKSLPRRTETVALPSQYIYFPYNLTQKYLLGSGLCFSVQMNAAQSVGQYAQ
jgi:hypothetical protein